MQKIELTKDLKISALNEIKKYFSTERDENMGDLSAELFLNFITEKIAPFFYNQGIRDSHQYISEKLEDLYGLEKSTNI
ncbi:DUF2164 domain-containing protein [Pseudobacteroides cellulosolvens]|uniref:DUF2164 domain-containing protein n=1 Tax=Pseudobacteroides cellulosolvens ATCC 35603 = DSM 2933 TaxID=398512 RepID=A0A0L6JJ35_9FIRM|nr:DUF2164 domain-containing protein [Pseudobacteroides cellulosolvens]KNY25886.1 Protein of unknown function DUF2164 [Pseudobacteroides cellulosolvens ATCC 35603 = DSM 2933]